VLETDISAGVAGEQAIRPVPAERRSARSGIVNVILAVGVLAALAVPSYLSHVQRGDMKHVELSLGRASAVAEIYYEAHGTYAGLADPRTGLQLLDPDLAGISAPIATDLRYCLKEVDGRATAWVEGPGGTPTNEKPADCA
jgi:type II secretory pathway pseudopilin PulG